MDFLNNRIFLNIPDLLDVRYKYVSYANVFLFIWIILTSLISILDLSFGILFGLDYGTFMVINSNVFPCQTLNLKSMSFFRLPRLM